jgi:hypothetical protein
MRYVSLFSPEYPFLQCYEFNEYHSLLLNFKWYMLVIRFLCDFKCISFFLSSCVVDIVKTTSTNCKNCKWTFDTIWNMNVDWLMTMQICDVRRRCCSVSVCEFWRIFWFTIWYYFAHTDFVSITHYKNLKDHY